MATKLLQPTPCDSNKHVLIGHGTQFWTMRCPSTATAITGVDVPIQQDCKRLLLHFEGVGDSAILRGHVAAGVAWILSATVVDNLDGTVTIPATAHAMVELKPITITGSVNYDGTYTLLAASDANNIVITATYVAEDIASAMVTGWQDAVWTEDGMTIELPLALQAGDTIPLPASSSQRGISVIGLR